MLIVEPQAEDIDQDACQDKDGSSLILKKSHYNVGSLAPFWTALLDSRAVVETDKSVSDMYVEVKLSSKERLKHSHPYG